MKITKQHQKYKCPSCGSRELITLGLDQICCDCPWTNSFLLVQLGQLDSLNFANAEHLGLIAFDDLEDKANATEPIKKINQPTHLHGGAK